MLRLIAIRLPCCGRYAVIWNWIEWPILFAGIHWGGTFLLLCGVPVVTVSYNAHYIC